MSEKFVVQGVITDQRQRPVAGIVVRAFDKDLPSLKSDQLLGDAITDAEGAYEITFAEDRFRARERGRADLYIEVLGAGDTLLGRSPSRFNPEREERIDLTIDKPAEPRLSEYEQLVALLLPLVEPLSFAELTAEDIEFLVQDTRADQSRVSRLAAATRLARKSGVPAEAFYGWARREPPVPHEWTRVPDTREAQALSEILEAILTRLVATPPDELRDALLAAVAHSIIPGEIRDRIDEIIRDLVRSLYVQHQAIGRLRDDETGAPLVGTVVRILDLEASRVPEEIGRETTSDEGLFVITFGTAPGSSEPVTRQLRLAALDAAGNDTWLTDVRVAADQRDVLDFRIPVRRVPEPPGHALDQVIAAAQSQSQHPLHVPPDLLPFLDSRNIRTLGGIRRPGGLGRVDGLPVGLDDPAVRALEAHADLSRLSPDVASNAVLIEKGFGSVADITATPLPDFVSAVHETTGDYRAANMQVVARAQTAFLKNVLTGLAVERANGFAAPAADPADPAAPRDPLPERCGCDDCEAAVSPAAYLADLLGYARTHLKEKRRRRSRSWSTRSTNRSASCRPTVRPSTSRSDKYASALRCFGHTSRRTR